MGRVKRQRVSGWGRASSALSDIVELRCGEVPAQLAAAGPRGVLARGQGRSYGDAALNSGGRLLLVEGGLSIDLEAGTVTATSGTSFEQLLRACLPHGWTLPVLPGTRHLSLGGAIAADVHGKNHYADGSLGRWLEEMVLVDGTGTTRSLRPADPGFWATVGGMGLTGVVLSATLRLVRTESSWLEVHNRRCSDLDAVLAQLDADAKQFRWAVAWVDGLGPHRGRGIVSRACELGADRVPGGNPLGYDPAGRVAAPSVPSSVVTPLTARAFNALWWRRPGQDGPAINSLTQFFHPLDGVVGWNRLYGRHGFLQYQFAVPTEAAHVVGIALERLAAAGGAPFLGVLKRFGAAGKAPLSFPRPGWSLAVDLPYNAGQARVLDDLDELVASVGGAVYLAKDARLRAELLPVMYPRLAEWREVQATLDPQGRLQSDLNRRLGVTRHA
jgi:decaprenylphospho-beta-D-ribofuranose 2-oxidase